MIKAFRLGEVSAKCLSQFRLALEPSIAQMLAEQEEINPALMTQMESNILKVKALLEADHVTGYRNMDFHVLLAEATGSSLFIIILKTVRTCFNLIAPPKKKIQLETIRFHQRVLDAIKKRDPITAREQMYQHLIKIGQLSQEA